MLKTVLDLFEIEIFLFLIFSQGKKNLTDPQILSGPVYSSDLMFSKAT